MLKSREAEVSMTKLMVAAALAAAVLGAGAYAQASELYSQKATRWIPCHGWCALCVPENDSNWKNACEATCSATGDRPVPNNCNNHGKG